MPAIATAQKPNVTRDEIRARLMVGLEIHVELATRSKMFTGAPNVAHPDFFYAEPNTLTDPVVLGMPGVLPVMNKTAVEMSMRVGLALNCKIARYTKWDRKSYYYPDLPKAYQISQYDQPLCGEGSYDLTLPDGSVKKIGIIRAHLEEDAGKLLHEAPGGYSIDYSIVDLNRAGTPLLEIVTHPHFASSEEVVAFAQALRNICRFLGVTEGIMQKGHMRFEPNINVVIENLKDGKTYKTPIVEIKNLNSFKAVEGAIRYEYDRQIDHWLATGIVMKPGTKSTRGWNDGDSTTFLQREKEEADDYRYFPDPDLIPVVVDDAWLSDISASQPELPALKEKRYLTEYALNVKDTRALLDDPGVCKFFEAILALGVDPKRASAVVLNNLAKRANEKQTTQDKLGVTPAQIAAIIKLAGADKISSNGADELYGLCCQDPAADPANLAESKGLLQVSDDGALDGWIDQAIAANAKSVADYKSGKESAIGALVGAVMKLSKGKANPKSVQPRLKEKLAQ
jgi:aspartyl-tRNA(Asn)/glutamyl-tRNA(Gln) amidotransferase subunit B